MWCSPRLESLPLWVPGVAGCRAGLWKGAWCAPGSLTWVCPPWLSLFCSLDDDSDLHSPRYSFSEDSKWSLSCGEEGGWWKRHLQGSFSFESKVFCVYFLSSKVSPFCASLKKWDELHWRGESREEVGHTTPPSPLIFTEVQPREVSAPLDAHPCLPSICIPGAFVRNKNLNPYAVTCQSIPWSVN